MCYLLISFKKLFTECWAFKFCSLSRICSCKTACWATNVSVVIAVGAVDCDCVAAASHCAAVTAAAARFRGEPMRNVESVFIIKTVF